MHCDYFDAARCRSCALMGVPYGVQLADKQDRCVRVLAGSVPADAWLPAVSSPEAAFRNKAKLVAGGTPGAVTLGILDDAGHGVDLRECGLYEAGLSAALPLIADFVDEVRLVPYDVPTRQGELKHVLVTRSPTGQLMIRFVLRSRRHEMLLRKHLPRLMALLPSAEVVSLNLQPEHKAVLEGDVELVLTEQQTLPMRVNGITLHLPPNSFFQTNTAVAAELYRQAQQWVWQIGPESVWDLYCGVGGFALHCVAGPAGSVPSVLGIEVSPDAIDSARLSAAALACAPYGSTAPRFEVGDATAIATADGTWPELVIVNPPRRGIGTRLAGWLEHSTVRHVVYSSCNVESLARDLDRLPSLRARAARLFDMFPQTGHHEVMVLLERAPSGQRP